MAEVAQRICRTNAHSDVLLSRLVPIARTDGLLLLWQAPLGVRSVKHKTSVSRVDDSERSHVNCFIQAEVVGFQVLLDSRHSCSTRVSWWSPPVLPKGKLLRSSRHLFVWHSRSVNWVKRFAVLRRDTIKIATLRVPHSFCNCVTLTHYWSSGTDAGKN